MGTDLVLPVKCTIFWLNCGLRVYFDLYAPDFPKSTTNYFLHPSTVKSKTSFFGGVFGLKPILAYLTYEFGKL